MSETYYGRFYGFDTAPFHITPDPSLLFTTATHQQALSAIEYGIAAGKGFIVVSGEVGVGKTTVLKLSLDRLDPNKIKFIYLFNPALTVPDLYATILEELEVPLYGCNNPVDILRLLQQALLAKHMAGIQVVLAVDEAQNMPERTLEALRILSNLETAQSKLLQIILVGQPELETLLAKHSLRQLAQRVAVRARIKRLTFRQRCSYIKYRIQSAGRIGSKPLFSVPALWYIAFVSYGIPRTINICCDNALINGYGYNAERITLRIAHESCRSLHLGFPFRRLVGPAIAAAILLCAVIVGAALLRRPHAEPVHARTPAPASTQSPIVSAVDIAKPTSPPTLVDGPAGAALTVDQPISANPVPAIAAPNAEDAGAQSSDIPEVRAALDAPVKAAPASQPVAVRAKQDTTPRSAMGRAVASSNQQGPWPGSKWKVHYGDTLIKVCEVTYGNCDEQTIRAILKDNPQIGSKSVIYPGEIINMPERVGPGKSN